mmetsp:Transcript_32968/g.83707  ORF Transcript_32968/g.83707 Transcript_32968/m.83707 type:complete len:218 (-) Transcript_32968:308-961(-)
MDAYSGHFYGAILKINSQRSSHPPPHNHTACSHITLPDHKLQPLPNACISSLSLTRSLAQLNSSSHVAGASAALLILRASCSQSHPQCLPAGCCAPFPLDAAPPPDPDAGPAAQNLSEAGMRMPSTMASCSPAPIATPTQNPCTPRLALKASAQAAGSARQQHMALTVAPSFCRPAPLSTPLITELRPSKMMTRERMGRVWQVSARTASSWHRYPTR